MSAASTKSAFFRGITACLPYTLMIMPFGMLFGVVATETGFTLAQTMAFTTVVIAGAAQFTAVQLMTEGAPIAIIILSAIAVNLRMVMYAASLQPHLGGAGLWQRILVAYTNFDQTFAVSMQEYETRPDNGPHRKALFFLGGASIMVPTWVTSTLLGAVLGAQVPPNWELDFAMPVMFLAIIGPGLRSLAHIGAALTATILALCCAGLPFNLGLIVAALLGMGVGAELDRRGYGR